MSEENGKKQRNLAKLIGLLAVNPATPHSEQAEALGIEEDTLRREYHKKALEDAGLAIINPVILPGKVAEQLPKIWIKENGEKKRYLSKLISLLAVNPAMPHPEQAEALGIKEDILRNDYHKKALEDAGLAIINPVILPGKVTKQLQRIWIFVETSYAHNRDHTADPHNYQVAVASEIKRIIAGDFHNQIFLESIDIVLGGDWDIIVCMRATRQAVIHRLVIQKIRVIRHVLRTSTCFAEPSYEI